MTSSESLEVAKQAENFPEGMEKVIIHYGFLRATEVLGRVVSLIDKHKEDIPNEFIEECTKLMEDENIDFISV